MVGKGTRKCGKVSFNQPAKLSRHPVSPPLLDTDAMRPMLPLFDRYYCTSIPLAPHTRLAGIFHLDCAGNHRGGSEVGFPGQRGGGGRRRGSLRRRIACIFRTMMATSARKGEADEERSGIGGGSTGVGLVTLKYG